MIGCRLTERQRKFAEVNHGVLERFLEERQLPFDKYYDIVVFKFLKAVKLYDEYEDTILPDFAEIANRYMLSAIKKHMLRERQRHTDFLVLSLDRPLGNSNLTFGDILADRRVNICDDVCEKLSPAPCEYELLHTFSHRRAVNALCLEEVM